GFYCPSNTAQPMYCCAGYYCSEDTKTMTLCPENQYCPSGSVGGGTSCLWLASCPPGSTSASKFGLVLFVVLLVIGISIVFYIHKRIEASVIQIDDNESDSTAAGANKTQVKKASRVAQTFDIEFEHLGLTLPNGTSILQNVSGVLRSGRACAIMGPSGSGKTTLISMLTSKIPKDEGRILINGQEEDLSHYRKLIGFVPQEDVMMRELTVHDVLLHSAYMRLPSDLKKTEMTERVLEILDFLGLNIVMDSVVGDAERRGISGGQRKRVNIGMELVTDPSILFLDEPTSGLDSSTSGDVCKMLKSVARRKGLTVAAVIHSPSPVAFDQFDDLLLLSQNGRVVFHGPRTEAPAYFAAIGFPVPDNSSPSDFYLDVISNNVKSRITKKFKPFYLTRYWESYPPSQSHQKCHSRHKSVTMSPESIHQRSAPSSPRASMAYSDFTSMYSTPPPPENLTTWETLQKSTRIFLIESRMWWNGVFAETVETVQGIFLRREDPIRNTASPFMMFWLCLSRARLQIYRNQRQFLYDQLLHLGCGLFISVAASRFDYLGRQPDMICAMTPFQLQINCVNPTDHLTEVGVFIALGVCFAGISVGSMTFGNEKIVYWREKSSGLLTLPYYLAKVIADIPRIILAGIMFSISLIIFFNERSNYFYLLFIIIMLYAVAFTMGYLLSALVPQNRVSLVGTGFTLAWAIVFSGDAPDLADVMSSDASSGYSATRWLWIISAPRYAIEAIYLKEVQARPWQEITTEPLAHTYKIDQFWWCFQSMAIILFGWHVLALFSFKLKNRSKQK
ncbi:hypothetical protein EDD21DRAFT_299344, partial [Dissophora ornata]